MKNLACLGNPGNLKTSTLEEKKKLNSNIKKRSNCGKHDKSEKC